MHQSQHNIPSFAQFLALIMLFAYDVFTYVPEQYPMSIFKVAYYFILILLIALPSMSNKASNRAPIGIHGTVAWWLLFISLYFIRVFYDLYFVNIQQTLTANTYTIPFLLFCSAILPIFLFRHLDFSNINYVGIAKCLSFIIGFFATISFYNYFMGNADYICPDGRMAGNSSMDTIAFGHWGLSLLIFSLYAFSHTRSSAPVRSIIYLLLAALGVFAVITAGSRGAIVAMLICGIFLLYVFDHKILAIGIIPIFVLSIYWLYPILNETFETFNNYAIQRIYDTIFTQSDATVLTSERDILFEESFENFQSHPILGSSFLLSNGTYVHNFFIEAFLALGIFGGIFFIIMSLTTISQAYRLIKIDKKYILISTLFIQYVIYGFFSRSMSIMPIYWVTAYLVVYAYQFENTKLNNA